MGSTAAILIIMFVVSSLTIGILPYKTYKVETVGVKEVYHSTLDGEIKMIVVTTNSNHYIIDQIDIKEGDILEVRYKKGILGLVKDVKYERSQ